MGDNLLYDQTINFEVDGESFVFDFPDVRQTLRVEAMAASLRRADDPDGVGSVDGLSPVANWLYTGSATILVLLRKTSAKWLFEQSASGEPKISIEHIPDPEKLINVYTRFLDEVERFRNDGTPDRDSSSNAVVAGSTDSTQESV